MTCRRPLPPLCLKTLDNYNVICRILIADRKPATNQQENACFESIAVGIFDTIVVPIFLRSHIVGRNDRGNIGQNTEEYSGGKLRGFLTFMTLFALWLLMSGIYTTFQIFMGVVSVLLVVIIVGRMDNTDDAHVSLDISVLRFVRYLGWLLIEIAKSNWVVTKIILSPAAKTRQHLFKVPAAPQSDVAQVIFATSITLTPSTITVETEKGHFLVHALKYDNGVEDALADMGARVRATETKGNA